MKKQSSSDILLNEKCDKRKEIESIIGKLKYSELSINEIPFEYQQNMDIIREERKLNLRRSGRRGFDVIRQVFFVKEWENTGDNGDELHQDEKLFGSFEEFYNFLDGDVYDNACYYQYKFPKDILKKYHLNIEKLKSKICFQTETIDDYAELVLQRDIDEYNRCEKNKREVKQWINTFNDCTNYDELKVVCKEYEKTALSQNLLIYFFFYQYAYCNQYSKSKMRILMKYLSDDCYIDFNTVQGLCFIFDPKDVIAEYNYSQGTEVTNAKHKKQLKEFVKDINDNNIEKDIKCIFDNFTHYYYEITCISRYTNSNSGQRLEKEYPIYICRAFEKFNDFINYRNGDLRNCDLSNAFELNEEFDKYKIDITTKLPMKNKNVSYKINKIYKDGYFWIEQTWYNTAKQVVKERTHKFKYFFDFVYFLKGNLSNANLILCIGLKYLNDISNLNLHDAQMTSELCDKFKIPYDEFKYNKNVIRSFSEVVKNEKDTALILQTSRDEFIGTENFYLGKSRRISYISDLHLMHKIMDAKCRSKEDVIYLVQKIIDRILCESSELTLIGGDVSAEFSVFELFVRMLRKNIVDKHMGKQFIFILGNHELWEFPNFTLDKIVEKYRKLLKENNMYLLHNELFYRNEHADAKIISYNELCQMRNTDISEMLRWARLVIFGGIGFSGYNEKFNANIGLYRNTIDRTVEIKESKKFESLYNKLINILNDKNTIILTHMPKEDWSMNSDYHGKFVYVSGHTHKNIFFDDGEQRIYADNQIGYNNQDVHLKNFLIDNDYDCFSSYKDGIYKITSQEYQDFMHGKNIQMTFTRDIYVLYMLKKNNYYCFIHKSKKNQLCILNGGALKKLWINDIQYFFSNMDRVIKIIKEPLDKYTRYQEKIAEKIKKIGGSGNIHGCIIDIDFFNHVYINPNDMKITGYRASDMVNKIVYPNVVALLKAECPVLYSNYVKIIEEDKNNLLVPDIKHNEVSELPLKYLETDIYRVSREVKKMQRINDNILTAWYEVDSGRYIDIEYNI